MPLKFILLALTAKADGSGVDTVPISTNAMSAFGKLLPEALSPTLIPNRGLVNAFTTVPDICVQLDPPFVDTNAVIAFVAGTRSSRSNTFVVALLAAVPTVAGLPPVSHHQSTVWLPVKFRHKLT